MNTNLKSNAFDDESSVVTNRSVPPMVARDVLVILSDRGGDGSGKIER